MGEIVVLILLLGMLAGVFIVVLWVLFRETKKFRITANTGRYESRENLPKPGTGAQNSSRKLLKPIFLVIASQAIPFSSAYLAIHFGRILVFLAASMLFTTLVTMTLSKGRGEKISVVHIATSIVPLSSTYFIYLVLLCDFDISRIRTSTLW